MIDWSIVAWSFFSSLFVSWLISMAMWRSVLRWPCIIDGCCGRGTVASRFRCAQHDNRPCIRCGHDRHDAPCAAPTGLYLRCGCTALLARGKRR